MAFSAIQLVLATLAISTPVVFVARWILRVWLESSSNIPDQVAREGHGFQSDAVRDRVEDVRRDFDTAVRATRIETPAHEELLAATRRAIAGFAYFRNRRSAANRFQRRAYFVIIQLMIAFCVCRRFSA